MVMAPPRVFVAGGPNESIQNLFYNELNRHRDPLKFPLLGGKAPYIGRGLILFHNSQFIMHESILVQALCSYMPIHLTIHWIYRLRSLTSIKLW